MKKIDGLTLHIQDLLRSWKFIQPRRMFGGIGLFVDGLMFAIIIDEILYLKETLDETGKPVETNQNSDDQDEHNFVREYFQYETKNGVGRLYYYQVPESALDNPDFLSSLAAESLKSAQNQAFIKAKKTKKNKKSQLNQTGEFDSLCQCSYFNSVEEQSAKSFIDTNIR